MTLLCDRSQTMCCKGILI
uniref:Uncharacterized protein n=1 Tax=Arundo donax TaxID=35708 RepID=A0A0A9EFZ6_ARUDO